MTQPTPTTTHLTPEEIKQAEIEAWTTIRDTAWNQFLTAVERLFVLQTKQNLCSFVQKLDKIRKSHYN
jgi:hypothetical protein